MRHERHSMADRALTDVGSVVQKLESNKDGGHLQVADARSAAICTETGHLCTEAECTIHMLDLAS